MDLLGRSPFLHSLQTTIFSSGRHSGVTCPRCGHLHPNFAFLSQFIKDGPGSGKSLHFTYFKYEWNLRANGNVAVPVFSRR